MAQPATESERVTAFFASQVGNFKTQVSDWIFRIVESNDHRVAVVGAAGSACVLEAHPQFLSRRWLPN
jgi:hypothetical protein